MANLEQCKIIFLYLNTIVIADIKPIKKHFSQTMKNIDVLYTSTSLENFINSIKRRKDANDSKSKEAVSENSNNRIHELKELNR